MNPRERSQHDQNLGKLTIFASGFSRHTTTAQVADYFSKYGYFRVEKYESYFKRHQDTTRFKGGEGYFILSDLQWHTYHSILQACPHRIQSRCLEVCPLKTGLDLIFHNCQKNQRRVLIKKVPIEVDEQEILDAIRVEFGLVEKFFGYKSETKFWEASSVLASSNKKVTYSVTFQAKSSAAKAVRKGYMILRLGYNPITVIVEKFKRTKLGQNDWQSPTINPSITPIENPKQKSFTKSGIHNSAKREVVLAHGKKDAKEFRPSKLRRGSSRSAVLRETETDTGNSRVILDARTRGETISGPAVRDSAANQHHVKPTSHSYRSQLSAASSVENIVFRYTLGCKISPNQGKQFQVNSPNNDVFLY